MPQLVASYQMKNALNSGISTTIVVQTYIIKNGCILVKN